MINLRFKTKPARLLLLFAIYCLLFTMVGCDAFVRKFTRKKKGPEAPVEMVLAPEEYKPKLNKEEQYRQYLLFWKSWQNEIIEALLYSTNRKKPIDCAQEALKNLVCMRAMLKPDVQKKMDKYVTDMSELLEDIRGDVYGNNAFRQRYKAERLKMDVLRDFSYDKVKDALQ